MSLRDHASIGEAKNIPTSAPTPVLSVSPVVLSIPGRPVDLELRVSVPTSGSDKLPIILLSHGHGRSKNLSSLNGYGPLANFWAGHGFAVVQPTHLSSLTLSFDTDTPGAPYFWRSRVEDMKHIIDQLDHIEASVPGLEGRLDRSRIAIAGHSLGSHTAALLLGARTTDPDDGWKEVNLVEPRIKVGILLTSMGNGNGGKDLSDFSNEHLPFARDLSFTEMKTPALVVIGEEDESVHLTRRPKDWHADPYFSGAAPKTLLTLSGAKHLLGGISGYDASETTVHDTESPERVAVVQRLTWAYLRSALYPGDETWSSASAALQNIKGLGKIESK